MKGSRISRGTQWNDGDLGPSLQSACPFPKGQYLNDLICKVEIYVDLLMSKCKLPGIPLLFYSHLP